MTLLVSNKMQSVARVLSLKRKLETDSEIAGFYESTPLKESDYYDFTAAVVDALGDVSFDAVYRSMFELYGSVLTKVAWSGVAWRLSANFDLLKAGLPAKQWSPGEAEEVTVQVVEARLCRLAKRRKGYDLSFRILTGTPASLLTTRIWTEAFCYVIASRVGFSNSRGKYPMENPLELVGTRLQVIIEEKKEDSVRSDIIMAGPRFDKVSTCSSANKAYNRRLIKKRRRIEFECPRKYSHECFRCPIGYYSCPAAVHPRDYELQLCSKCNKRSWTDPKFSGIGVCVRCLATMK